MNLLTAGDKGCFDSMPCTGKNTCKINKIRLQCTRQFNNEGYLKKETNMKRRMRSVLLVVTLAVSVALSGCSGDKKTTESATENELSKNPVEGGSIKVGISQDLDSLDPHKAVAAGTKEVLFNIFEGLVKPDSDGNLVEAVADSYEISEDAKVYTLSLIHI